MKFYQVVIGYEYNFYLDKAEAENRYRMSGESCKYVTECELNLTPDFLIEFLNIAGLNLIDWDFGDLLSTKYLEQENNNETKTN
jgi:hypothetical protein